MLICMCERREIMNRSSCERRCGVSTTDRPPPRKWVAALWLGYLVSPLDLLPGLLFGPLGFVDDLLMLTAAISSLLNHVHPDRVRAHWSGQGDVLEVLHRVSAWCESVFRDRLRALFPAFTRARGSSEVS